MRTTINCLPTDDWKKATCGDCKYQVADSCRRFPPTQSSDSLSWRMGYTGYPAVVGYSQQNKRIEHSPACAEYVKKPEETGESDVT